MEDEDTEGNSDVEKRGSRRNSVEHYRKKKKAKTNSDVLIEMIGNVGSLVKIMADKSQNKSQVADFEKKLGSLEKVVEELSSSSLRTESKLDKLLEHLLNKQ